MVRRDLVLTQLPASGTRPPIRKSLSIGSLRPHSPRIVTRLGSGGVPYHHRGLYDERLVMPDFPQIPESEAIGQTALIYAALRQATGVPTVNLIWRHFAALPGVL